MVIVRSEGERERERRKKIQEYEGKTRVVRKECCLRCCNIRSARDKVPKSQKKKRYHYADVTTHIARHRTRSRYTSFSLPNGALCSTILVIGTSWRHSRMTIIHALIRVLCMCTCF